MTAQVKNQITNQLHAEGQVLKQYYSKWQSCEDKFEKVGLVLPYDKQRARFIGMLEIAKMTGIDVSEYNWVYVL